MKEQRGKDFLGLFLLGILFLSVFLGSVDFVSAASHGSDGAFKQIWDSLFGNVFNFDTGEEGEFFGQSYEKLLLVFLLVMLVYSVMEQLKLSENQGINWAISFAVGVLGFIAVKDETIDLILTNYTALGVVLTSILPLVIVLFFAIKLRQNNKTNIVGILVPKVIYVLFSIYLFFSWASYEGADQTLKNVYLLTFVVVFLWMAFIEKKAMKWVGKEIIHAKVDSFKDKIKKQAAKRDAEAADVDAQ